MSIWDWISGLVFNETEYPSLAKYMDVEAQRAIDPGRSAAAAIGTSIFTLGVLLGVGAGLFFSSWMVALGLSAMGALLGMGWFQRYTNGQNGEERELNRVRREAREYLGQLKTWRFLRMLKSRLPGGAAELLDAAANSWLRTAAALQTIRSHSPRQSETLGMTEDTITNAMDSGMSRLILMARDGQLGNGVFLAPSFDQGRKIADEMLRLSKETEKLCDRKLFAEAEPGTPVDDLRAALSEVEQLTRAEAEVQRISLRH
jgi:hypothetical protein